MPTPYSRPYGLTTTQFTAHRSGLLQPIEIPEPDRAWRESGAFLCPRSGDGFVSRRDPFATTSFTPGVTTPYTRAGSESSWIQLDGGPRPVERTDGNVAGPPGGTAPRELTGGVPGQGGSIPTYRNSRPIRLVVPGTVFRRACVRTPTARRLAPPTFRFPPIDRIARSRAASCHGIRASRTNSTRWGPRWRRVREIRLPSDTAERSSARQVSPRGQETAGGVPRRTQR